MFELEFRNYMSLLRPLFHAHQIVLNLQFFFALGRSSYYFAIVAVSFLQYFQMASSLLFMASSLLFFPNLLCCFYRRGSIGGRGKVYVYITLPRLHGMR